MLNPELAHIRSFEVVPSLPEPLKPLLEVAYNLWWTWHPEAYELFIRLDRQLWEDSDHNPVKMLGMAPQELLDATARDEGFLTTLRHVTERLRMHFERRNWARTHAPGEDPFTVAYFSAEFGLHECLPIYSGGLGCLAGDHLKSASELALPLIGVGLLYRNGYFQQYLNADGWQQERYPELDFTDLPIEKVTDDAGDQVKVSVDMPKGAVAVALWKAKVGRVDLYLLDTNLPENTPGDRGITGKLYGGDQETRIRQEIVLGIGGVRALEAIGIRPDVAHMNEGHAAFLALERIRRLVEDHDITFDEARQAAAASHVFTTHTPVPAGIDRFPPSLVEKYFRPYVGALRLDMEGMLSLGRENVFNKHEAFSMAVLAIRTSDWLNGVSKLHGDVSRGMWHGIWPNIPEDEVPIQHVTNGVHARSWLSSELITVLDRYLGSRWQAGNVDTDVWEQVYDIPDVELWRLHERRRQRLVVWARRRLKHQLEARGVRPSDVRETCESLRDDALTIGFARRFATYKRGTLFMQDVDRLLRMMSDADRPIQFFIAGKSHPADGSGKQYIREIVQFAADSDLGHRIVFLENYDIGVARYLVQGCDIWLNNPRRGMEASGTSGMKAALNGVLNCSVLDGWWDEAYESDLGWAIGQRETYADHAAGDSIESQALYDLLEKRIVPMFYDRDDNGVPCEWVQWMKRCIAVLAPKFNTNRMVNEYATNLYLPALKRGRKLAADNLAGSIALAHQKDRLRGAWNGLEIRHVEASTREALGIGHNLPVTVEADLGELTPAEVRVQAYMGRLGVDGAVLGGRAIDLDHREDLGGGRHRFAGTLTARTSGSHGFAVRIVPGGDAFNGITEPGLIKWEGVSPVPAGQRSDAAPALAATT